MIFTTFLLKFLFSSNYQLVLYTVCRASSKKPSSFTLTVLEPICPGSLAAHILVELVVGWADSSPPRENRKAKY